MKFSVLILFLLSCLNMEAQTIWGRVLDEKEQPVSYANVVLLTADSVFIEGAVTTDTGEFSFHPSQIKNEKYRLKISYIGYETQNIICQSNSLGDIALIPQANVLSEISVTAPYYKMKGNGLVVSVQNTLLSHLEDVGKMLEFIPGLQYGNDGLSVFGKGKPIVYLNGRILTDMSELERIKSSDISTVEVIKNPGAAYSASSQAVVKIRTIRKKGDGLSLDLKSYFQLAHSTRLGETVQANYRSSKFDMFAYLNYLKANDYETENSHYDVKSKKPFRLNSMQKEYIERDRYTGKAGFDYYFTPRQNIGAYYSCTYHDIEGNGNENITIDENGKMTDTQFYHIESGITSPIHRVNAYYSGHIGPIDINFNNDIYLSKEKQFQFIDGRTDIHGAQNAATKNNLKNSLAASDLTLRYQKGKSIWEIGTAYNYIRRTNNYNSEGGIDLDDYQKIQENKWAVYGNYQLSLDKWNVDAGIRYELYQYDYYKNDKHMDEQSKVYRNLYPSLSVSRPIGNIDVNLSYSIKTQKPQYNALDGNMQYISRNLYRGGNPLLKPSTMHDLQLSMVYKGLAVSADYIQMKNPLYYTYRFYDAEQTVILSSYDNYPKVDIFQAEVSYSQKIGFWKPQLTIDLLKSNYRLEQSGVFYKQNDPLVTLNFNQIFTLPSHWYIYLYTRYQSRGCNEEALKLSDNGRISLYVVKMWKNFTFDILFNDIFRSNKNSYSTLSPACTFHTSQYYDTQNIQINVRYRLNTTRSKYKGSDAAGEELNRM